MCFYFDCFFVLLSGEMWVTFIALGASRTNRSALRSYTHVSVSGTAQIATALGYIMHIIFIWTVILFTQNITDSTADCPALKYTVTKEKSDSSWEQSLHIAKVCDKKCKIYV